MKPLYLDYHATTPVDPRVLAAMLPYFTERFGNAASKQHAWGWEARDAAKGVEGITDAKVDVVWEPGWTKDRMSDVAKMQLGMW